MGQYEKLADIYDYLVSSVDYEAWVDYIRELMAHFNREAEVVVDLACGTGNTTIPLARRGYHTVGLDLSPEMLAKASAKAEREQLSIEFLQQNMCTISLPSLVDLFVCYHDGLNYLLKKEDLEAVFRSVKKYLKPGGLFIFDLVNVARLARMDGGTTHVDEDDLSLIWETRFLRGEDIWEIDLTCFVRRGDLYEKFRETHREKAHSRREIEAAVKGAGLSMLGVFHSYTLNPPSDNTYRLFFVVENPA
ncbi:MAG TPA: class I SAM-dependent methyltransferase [Bacillota bacterium]|nr:class I SAM-dependent methyltransferase [Bacillota bacterium]